MTNFNQYFLLVDHIKLSLLERHRTDLNLDSASHDQQISQSLASLHEGIERMIDDEKRLEESDDNG